MSRRRKGSAGVVAVVVIAALLRLVVGLESGSTQHASLPAPFVTPEIRLNDCLTKAGHDEHSQGVCFAAFERDREQQQRDCAAGTTTDPATGLPLFPEPGSNPAVPPDQFNCPPGTVP